MDERTKNADTCRTCGKERCPFKDHDAICFQKSYCHGDCQPYTLVSEDTKSEVSKHSSEDVNKPTEIWEERFDEEAIHPVLHEIYGLVCACYQKALHPDKPVLGHEAEYEKDIADDVKDGDISNIMSLFTGALNGVNRDIAQAFARREKETRQKTLEELEEAVRKMARFPWSDPQNEYLYIPNGEEVMDAALSAIRRLRIHD